jgi:hypothetical protein
MQQYPQPHRPNMPESFQLSSFKRSSLKSTYGPVTEDPRPASNAKSLLLDTWIPECTAIVWSLVCMGAIVGVLRGFENRPLPSLPVSHRASRHTLA